MWLKTSSGYRCSPYLVKSEEPSAWVSMRAYACCEMGAIWSKLAVMNHTHSRTVRHTYRKGGDRKRASCR